MKDSDFPAGKPNDDPAYLEAAAKRERLAMVCREVEAKYGLKMWAYGLDRNDWPAEYLYAYEEWKDTLDDETAALRDWERRSVVGVAPQLRELIEREGPLTLTELKRLGPPVLRWIFGVHPEYYEGLPGLRLVPGRKRVGHRLELAP